MAQTSLITSAIQNATDSLSNTFGLKEEDKMLLKGTLQQIAIASIESYRSNTKNQTEETYRDIIQSISIMQ